MEAGGYRSGFISVVGRTNVGKSTLLNALIGQKMSIVSDKPQTTRNMIRLVLTEPGWQMVFLDTPGFHRPKTRLSENMVRAAGASMDGVDAILFVTENDVAIGKGDRRILASLEGKGIPVVVAINKMDRAEKSDILKKIALYADFPFVSDIVPISALKGDNLGELKKTLLSHMPFGPMFFPEGMLTDRTERFFVSEIVREKALSFIRDEIPHGVAVEIMGFRQRKGRDLIDVEANIFVRRDTHKAIVIGKGGAQLKKIASAARRDMEALLACQVNLSIWVKTKPDWEDSPYELKELGYDEHGM
ncbi:MAG: GTPase Era [Eubacteriaceae bacterium]|jgi:GTP-binding protein Era|nr:GTPase Era [Eubacteriaceae bacterium]